MSNSEKVAIPDDEGIVVETADGGDNSNTFIDELGEPEEVVTTPLTEQ